MLLLSSALNDESHRHPLLVLQSSLAQSCLPIVRHILTQGSFTKQSTRDNLLFCLFFPPSSLFDKELSDSLQLWDWVDRIPVYKDFDVQGELLGAVGKALEVSTKPLNIIIDSVDTLLDDKVSLSSTFKFLSTLFALTKQHRGARLILHSLSPSPLLLLITQTEFSSSLCHVIAHPTALINHLATEFLIAPPPLTPVPKFWSIFLPISERVRDTEQLVFGNAGEGNGNHSEFVVELVVREGSGRKRGVERVLEGWLNGPCDLASLEALRHLMKKEQISMNAPDPSQNLSFNLNLTKLQQESRAQVPLPYAHKGTPLANEAPSSVILYDPDSADDIDDDDPDEDLDI